MSAPEPRPAPARTAKSPIWARVALVTTGLGLVLGLLGPFGSFASPGLAWRVGYWIAVIWLGLLIYGGLIMLARRQEQWRWAYSLPALASLIAIGSVPQAAVSRALAFAVWPDLPRIVPPFWLWYLQVLLIALVIGLAVRFWRSRTVPEDSRAPASGGSVADASAPWPADIIALQMEDHYVRVHRPGASKLVLMTLRTAMARVEGQDGLQVHRSWWVARSAITAIAGDSRTMRLELAGGLVVPVARNRIAALRSAGWLG